MRVPPVEGRRRSLGLRGWLIVAAVLLVIFLLSLRGLARFYTDYLWFQDIGYSHTWRQLLSAKAVPALIFGAVFFVLMLVNLIVADRVAPRYRGTGPEDEIIERYRGYVAPYAGRVRVGVSLFFAVIMASGVSAQWQNWILFSHASKFHIKDPQFHKDIGFYVFRLPFEQFAAGWTFAALLVVLIVSAVFHYLNGGIRLQSPYQRVTPQVKVHLSVLLALMALTKTVQYYLAQFSLTLSHRGAVDGATYTDVHAQLPALQLLMLISIAAAILFIVNIWRRGWVFPIIAVGLWGFVSIVVGTVYPAVIQRFTVQPNELAREQKYIERNITATRDAFKLNDNTDITSKAFPYSSSLNASDTKEEQPTLDNVRLYDPRPAQDDFKVDEARSTAYEFQDVDVDRYKIGEEKAKPTLISVRELDQANLPDQSWTSQHLVYTHGYAAVAAAANQVNVDRPSYVLSNIPPQGDPGIDIDPHYAPVYFDENLSGYAVVDTKVPEQEATGGAPTQTTKYTGDAGVPVQSFLRKAALALRFGDWNLLVSGQITNSSRVIYIRDIVQRVQTAAPFLKFDSDPYPVVLNKRIVWVIDGYTTTGAYPYSQSIHPDLQLAPGTTSGLDTDFNYVRNSVKATVDAYDGTVKFYVIDPTDPIIHTYRKAFPELFTDASKLPAGLRDHFRYPEDLFSAQTQQYALYHITDPVQYFNKQDIWDIAPLPNDTDASAATPVTNPPPGGNNGGRNTTLPQSGSPSPPLYLTLQVPGTNSQQFVLERAFTPRRKNGILSSFMMALNDGDNYGKLALFTVADASAPSSLKAASAIESDQFISSQFTLLGQGGSSVERGSVQLIPVGNTVLYIRPIWITGGQNAAQEYPRYRFIAAVTGDRAVLGYNVKDAVTALLTGNDTQLQKDVQGGRSITNIVPPTGGGTASTSTTTAPSGPPATPPPGNATATQLLGQAQQEFDAADAALQANPPDFAAYEQHIRAARADVVAASGKITADRSPSAPSTTTPKSAASP
jgi:uncharacterized membrane protein (UPF0182 family)